MSNQSNPFQQVTTLGKLKSVHGFDPFVRNNRLILSGIVLAGMSTCFLITVYAWLEEAHKNSRTPEPGMGLTISIAAFLILLGAFIIFGFISEWWRLRNYMVGLFDGGLVIQLSSNNIHPLPWNDIRQVQEFRYRNGFKQYYLETLDGRQFLLHRNLRDLTRLGKAVIQNSPLIKR